MNGRGIPSLLNKMKTVIAFGNPLLDTTVHTHDAVLFEKYKLPENGQKEVSKDEMQNISKEISGYKHQNSAGGCSQNSLRVLQWVLHKQCRAIMFGSVGKDNEAVHLKSVLHKDGVQARYVLQNNLPTGRTIALIKGGSRCLVAYIGAAEIFSLKELLQIKGIHNLLQESDFVYVEGFFLTNRVETAKYILDFCNMHNKTVIFNICGKYVCDKFPEAVQYFVENADIIFGNKSEFKAVSKIMNLKSMEELTEKLIKNEKNIMNQYNKIIVITDGAKPVTCIYEDGKIEYVEAVSVKEEDIVDTTAAGDAFTGGFIAGLCREKSIQKCAEIGSYMAYHIIKQTGCTLPNFRPDIID